MFSCKIEVRFNDFDGMGHVNNAVFLTYLEIARINYMKKILEVDGSYFEDRKFNFILAHVSIDYKKPIEVQHITAQIWLSKISKSSFEFSYKLVDDENKSLYALANSIQVCYDYKLKKTTLIPDELRTLLQKELDKV